VFVIGSEGTVQGIYDKVRLVPFGEYVPFKPLLELLGISNLAGPLEGFEAGYQPRVLTTSESFGFLPMICYEAIFPGSLDGVSKRPDFLLNVTNDAWFGRTPGPYQHLAQARLRAIESGLPLIRAANTGISAVIDPKGRVVAKLAIFERGLIDARLPQRLGNTLYGSIGDGPALVFSFFIVVFAGVYQYNRNSRIN
jgi:apolipoprotein N-acyltransferase